MISLDKIKLKFGNRELLKGISFLINPKDHIGLVGKNGSGKSTILKIITQEIKPDEGKVVVPSDISVGYLSQHMKCNNDTNIINEAGKAFKKIINIQQEIEFLNTKITNSKDFESLEYINDLNRLSFLTERLELFDINKKEERIEKCLLGLGFKRKEFNRNTVELSGGWRMRIEIAKILLQRPKLLLLDEPTNHLDIESIQWLENFLKEYSGSLVLISHDRAFLDNITNRTIEISLGQIYDYSVPYSEFLVLKKERYEQQKATYRNQQKIIEDTEKFIEKFRYKASKAVQVQSRIKQLEKLDRIEVDQQDNSGVNIKFPSAPRTGKLVVEAENVSKSYKNHLVLDMIDFSIERGEKVAFVGKNGEGKTTLSKIIVNELDYIGKLKIGHNVHIGYFAQDQDQIMNENLTVFETVDAVAVGDVRTRIRDILGAFLFSGEDIDKKVKVLSGGERSRLALVKLLLEPYNLLLMDEPTNHLDMYSKELLKEALIKYDGTLIIVSHDRYFLDGLVNKVYEFKNKKIIEHLGGIYDFLWRKKISSLKELETDNNKVSHNNKEKFFSSNKETYLEKKQFEKKLRKLRKKIEDSEFKISHHEAKLNELNQILSNPEKIKKESEQNIFIQYEQIKSELDKEINNWEILHNEYEKLEQKNNIS